MRSWTVVAFLGVAVAGVLAVVVAAAGDDRDLAFTLGVSPGMVAAEMPPGTEACQVPVPAAEQFDSLRIQVGTYGQPGQPMAVSVRRLDSGRTIAAGRLSRRYADVSQPEVALGATVPAGERVAVCLRNVGRRKLALYGGSELARRRSTVRIDGRDQRTDLMLVFTRASRSTLSQVPEMFARASLFRPVWIDPWVYWLLTVLLVTLVPALLAFAIRAATPGSD